MDAAWQVSITSLLRQLFFISFFFDIYAVEETKRLMRKLASKQALVDGTGVIQHEAESVQLGSLAANRLERLSQSHKLASDNAVKKSQGSQGLDSAKDKLHFAADKHLATGEFVSPHEDAVERKAHDSEANARLAEREAESALEASYVAEESKANATSTDQVISERATKYFRERSGVECRSSDRNMGSKGSVRDCAHAVQASGGSYFIYGTGSKRGNCYLELTSTATCPQGWENDQYDFYSLQPSAKFDLVRSNVECTSGDNSLGNRGTVQDCARAAKAAGGVFFVYGQGSKQQKCYKENTRSKSCPEGWEADSYDFYAIQTTTTTTTSTTTTTTTTTVPKSCAGEGGFHMFIFAAILSWL